MIKTVWYRIVHFIRTLILGKPEYYASVDYGYGVDHNAVSLMTKHKDGGVTVVWSKTDPTIEDLEKHISGKISEQEWQKLTQYDWGSHPWAGDDIQDEDTTCPKCGYYPIVAKRCDVIGCDDGWIDCYDEDPLWYDEGDSEMCDECCGTGWQRWCPKCGYDVTRADHADEVDAEY